MSLWPPRQRQTILPGQRLPCPDKDPPAQTETPTKRETPTPLYRMAYESANSSLLHFVCGR